MQSAIGARPAAAFTAVPNWPLLLSAPSGSMAQTTPAEFSSPAAAEAALDGRPVSPKAALKITLPGAATPPGIRPAIVGSPTAVSPERPVLTLVRPPAQTTGVTVSWRQPVAAPSNSQAAQSAVAAKSKPNRPWQGVPV